MTSITISQKTLDAAQKDIEHLIKTLDGRDLKYQRSYNRFMSNAYRNESIRSLRTLPSSFYNRNWGDQETGVIPAINVGRSMVLTLTSKMIQTKGRIFFDSINGMWETIKVTRNAQIYFDSFVEYDKLYEKVELSVLEGNLFDTGIMWTDEDTKTNQPIHPWQFYCDPVEYNYKKLTRCLLRFDDYPLSALGELIKGTRFEQMHERNKFTTVTLKKYWDIDQGIKITYADDDRLEVKKIDYKRIPFSFYFYQKPTKGYTTNSVMDNVYPIQKQIDSLLHRMHDALELNPIQTIFVPGTADQSGFITKVMNTKAGLIIPFNPALGGQPVSFTPPPFDPMYTEQLNDFIQKAYDQEGISQLSATSKIQSNVTSGKMVDTVQDVESERFQSQVDGLIQFYKDIFECMIEVFPDEEILPSRMNRAKAKWKQIKAAKDEFTLQSSLASVLSKDPQTKMEQVEKLQAQGVINAYMAADILRIPDIDKAYSAASASWDYCQNIIEHAIDSEIYEFYNVVDLNQLMYASVNILCQLASVDEKPAIIERVLKLIEVVSKKINEAGQMNNPPPAPALPPPKQTDDILKAIDSIKLGMPAQSAMGIIQASYPGIPPEQLQAIFAPFMPPPEPQAPAPAP